MKTYLLDTSALLTLRDDESGADMVADLLKQAQSSNIRCLGCFISLMEVLYRVWRDEGETAGQLAYEQCMALPVEWIHETSDLLKQAAAIKATYPLSAANAWIAASALQEPAILIHKDPEFLAVDVEQEPLPFK